MDWSRKKARSASSRKMVRRSIPRTMTWETTPVRSTPGFRGMPGSLQKGDNRKEGKTVPGFDLRVPSCYREGRYCSVVLGRGAFLGIGESVSVCAIPAATPRGASPRRRRGGFVVSGGQGMRGEPAKKQGKQDRPWSCSAGQRPVAAGAASLCLEGRGCTESLPISKESKTVPGPAPVNAQHPLVVPEESVQPHPVE